MPLSEVTRTGRGFEVVEFKDCYGCSCSLQASSLAGGEEPGMSAVWLGVADAEPKVMASVAASLGIETEETCGWVPYPIPTEVFLNTRMHLNRQQVEDLILHLCAWLDEGTFEIKEKDDAAVVPEGAVLLEPQPRWLEQPEYDSSVSAWVARSEYFEQLPQKTWFYADKPDPEPRLGEGRV